ncbi:sulfite exporter TauE/SafE family protein [Klebsiella pneumoniae]|nr:sulfite exporter TauE/SafE family protein [Klebsiella pneumoniae]
MNMSTTMNMITTMSTITAMNAITTMTMITAMTITMRPHPPRRWWRRSGRTRISGLMLGRSSGALMATQVTTGQIVLFGLTRGLIPCPASITVLLICLQLKKFSLGATLVLGFSVGLALTLVASGAIAALNCKLCHPPLAVA